SDLASVPSSRVHNFATPRARLAERRAPRTTRRGTMIGPRPGSFRLRRRAGPCGGAATALVVLATAAAAPGRLVPPEPQTQPTQQTQPHASAPTEQQAPGYRPGFIDAFGRWIGDSVNNWNNTVKDATGAAQDAADTAGNVARGAANAAGTVTRDTAGAVARIPGTRVIAERATCPVAP